MLLLKILMNLMNMSTKKVVFIVGPTAIGKTALSIRLAQHFNTEIISCDSRQFYKELLIGAAPPDENELEKIKHHFIHNLSVTNSYNAGQFEVDALLTIEELHQKHDVLIAIGGSGLYVDAICKGFDKLPEISSKTRENINSDYNKLGIEWLQKEVQKIDPKFYKSCDKNNPQRLLRALEVYKETGKTFSSFRTNTHKERSFEIIKIGLNIDREKLYSRINKRVDIMMNNGLLEEVISLEQHQHLNALQTVGYKEIFSFLNNETTLENAVEQIKQNTRSFAKRQLTWFRKDKNTKWFEPQEIEEIKTFIGL
jgi:tRNA dimethylallyltransferase